MRYFKLSQDKRIPYGVLLTRFDEVNGVYEYRKGDASALDDSFISLINSSPVNFYPDILDRQIFMIKGAVKDVLDIFMPEIEYKNCCLVDEPNNVHEHYYIPMLETLDIRTGMELESYIFRIAASKTIEVLASLEFVEALLRRKPIGCRVMQYVPQA